MANEAKDDARSTQLAQVLDLWSEGPITGLVNGLKSVYLDKVPIENADGTRNFENVQFDWVRGTQGQAALPGITAVQNEVSVGITVLAATPVVRSISTVGVDTVRVTIATGQLTTTNPDNGDLNGAAFDYAIDVKSGGGAWAERFSGTVKAKVTTVYRRAVMVQLQGAGPWDIRVRRLTPDSTSQLLQNAFTWTSYTEIKTLKLRMPNSAGSALTVNAANFSRIPDRAFDVLGIEVEVPSNYDPINRTYAGAWDGTFKRAWTNNPAWVFYAMGINTRWGLGRYITAAQLNKWQLYTIGRYCDVLVPSGRKNPDGSPIKEPRFTIGLYMQTRGEARQVMQDLAALFRSIAFWAGGQLQTVQDAPSDATMLFTPSNVVDGLFQYQSSSDLQRHSVFIVYWNDLSQFGLRVPEVYVDEAAVTRYGIRELELSPIGTTSRGQAQRLARWAAYSEAMEGETVSFKVGADGALVLPGKVFGIADPSEAGDRMGGRVRSATTLQVTLDAPVELRAGEAYTLSVQLPDAAGMGYSTEERPVTTPAGASVGVVSVFPAFSAAPAAEAVWLLQSDAVAATTWRCLGVVEVAGKDQYEISGVRHDPAKFDLIELGVRIDPRPISRVRLDSPLAINLAATEAVVIDGPMPRSRVTFSWTPGSRGLTHQVSYSLAGGPRVTLPETAFQSVDISGLWPGELRLYVRSQNSIGNVSREVIFVITLLGKTAPAADVTGLASTIADTGLAFETVPYPQPDYAETELRRGVSWAAGIPLFGTTATRFSGTRFIWPRPAIGTYTVWAKWIDTTGHPSANAVSITVVVNAAAVLQWANIAGVPANLAGLTGSEAIRNADIIVGGYNLATRSNDFSLFNQANAGTIVSTGQPDHLGAANATRLTCTSGQPGGWDRYRHFSGLRPGVTYTASVWVKRETAGNFCLTPTNGLAWNTGTTGVVTATGWQRATAQVQAGSTGVVDIALGGHSNGAYPPQQPGNVLIAYFQLEEGNAATQWGAAPEDIAGLISGAQQTADAANTQLAAIASDSVLTKGEKADVILDWSVADRERPGIEAQANAYAIYGGVQSDYLNALNALAVYLQSIPGGWNNLATDSPIDGSAFRSAWATFYTARQTLLNKISAVAGTLSTWNGTSGRPLDAYNMVFTPTFEGGSAGAWEGTVVAVAGQPFTKAIQFTHRDNHEAQEIPVRGGETLYVYASIDASTSTTGVTFGIEAHKAGGALSTAAGPWIGAIGAGPGTPGWVYGGQAITVPSDATYVLPWVQINGTGGVELPPARLTNLYIGRAQPGATLGADWATNVANIPYAAILNNDDSAALRLQFEDWPTGVAYPTGWVNWGGPAPTRETSIVRIGKDAVRYACPGTDGIGTYAIADFRSTPLPLGAFLSGSIDMYMPTRTSGLPGILVRLGYGTGGSSGDDLGLYEDTRIVPPSAATGAWQRVPWSARLAGAGRRVTSIRIFLMASWLGLPSGVFTGEVIFDNLLFALMDSSTDNTALTLTNSGQLSSSGTPLGTVTITGLGYSGALDATKGAPAGTYVGSQLAQDLVQTASNAAATASNAQDAAAAANQQLAGIASDSVLTRGEKPQVILDWTQAANEQPGIDAQANAYAIYGGVHSDYLNAFSQLSAYLQGISGGWNVLGVDSPIDGAAFRAAWSAYYAARQTLLNKIAEVAGTRAQYALVTGRPLLFRVVSRGAGDGNSPQQGGLFNGETGAEIGGRARSYVLTKLNRYTGLSEYGPNGFDVFGGTGAAAALAAELNSATGSQIVVVYTWDEPRDNRLGGGLPAAMYKCGASRAVFGSPQFRYRSAYILVGIGGCGEGNGYEAYSGSVDNDTNAWCDVAFQLASGQLIISGTSATPRTLADYSYTGDLDATRNRVYRQQADPGATAANGDRWIQTDAAGNAIAIYDRVGGNWYTGPSGPQGSQGVQGLPGANGQTTYFHIAYASAADGSAGFNQSAGTYVGTYVDYTAADSGDYHRYTWRQFVGSQGPQGGQGIPGTTGPGGTPSYLHIKYSNDGGASFTSSGGEDVGSWIGTYVDANPGDSGAVGAYTWARLQPPNFRQEGDPGAVQDGATWTVPSTGKSYVRQGIGWIPYVGVGSVGTGEIAANAATEVMQDVYDFGGAAFSTGVVRSLTVTPLVAATIEFTTTVIASSVVGDSGNYLGWYIQEGAGADVLLSGFNGYTSNKTAYQGIATYAAPAGVQLTFKLKAQRNSGAPAITLFQSSTRITQVKR